MKIISSRTNRVKNASKHTIRIYCAKITIKSTFSKVCHTIASVAKKKGTVESGKWKAESECIHCVDYI